MQNHPGVSLRHRHRYRHISSQQAAAFREGQTAPTGACKGRINNHFECEMQQFGSTITRSPILISWAWVATGKRTSSSVSTELFMGVILEPESGRLTLPPPNCSYFTGIIRCA
jgi:hypothetical protein